MYTLRQAAKATGKSKSTIQNAVKTGKISANRKDDGSYSIDPAELHRVYPSVSNDPVENPVDEPLKSGHMDTENIVRVKELEAELKYANKRIDDLENERDRWQKHAETLLLSPVRTPRNGFWPWWRNRS